MAREIGSPNAAMDERQRPACEAGLNRVVKRDVGPDHPDVRPDSLDCKSREV